MFGEQDPFFTFKMDDEIFLSEVKDGAGKHAVFNQLFELKGIYEAVHNGEELVLESFDKDLVSSDALGTSRPLDWLSFVHDEKP